ncbi:small ribosomal subunit biogenesis GTPase RsgA 1, mitochondrial-like [Pistacia vera]|uniref:small ribosomal subunit biogenesis GTPase RsgA 1, mitochondrial-like n=1 Tax=Pistacia vera TaxID=55513 RepID=UPI0012635A2C|nr:small ribosomal subunit biogenesis GTPase RsgA 1, mitochondrial-like [Pistacia vera]
MPISSISLFRHRATAVNNFIRHVSAIHHRQAPIVTAAAKHQQQKPKNYVSKNLLRAKQHTVKEFSSLAPVLSPQDKQNLTESQAIGTVAAAQANFMRVIVQPEPSRTSDSSSNITSGVELLCVVKAVLKKIKRRVLVGDKVVVGSIDWVDRRGMIENVFQRSTEILDPPVANVDHLLVLFSLDQPKPEPFTLTRFLVEAESTGIPLTLALNKVELVDKETLVGWNTRLHGWGYEPLLCSVESKYGLDSLASSLKNQTTVIVGPSGVGKSSLINALRSNPSAADAAEGDNWFEPILGSKWLEDQRVGEVSTRSGRGKHTTRHVSLLPLSGGGYLADTPGFNQPSLLKVTKQSLAQAFPEIRKRLKANEPLKCTFNDCLHIGEPGCVIKGDWERYQYYFQLLDEIRMREVFQLRTFGTKREGDVRYKMGDMGVQQAEPRLEPKKHRRQSRKKINQSILDELDEDEDEDELDEDEDELDLENDPILRDMRNESQ